MQCVSVCLTVYVCTWEYVFIVNVLVHCTPLSAANTRIHRIHNTRSTPCVCFPSFYAPNSSLALGVNFWVFAVPACICMCLRVTVCLCVTVQRRVCNVASLLVCDTCGKLASRRDTSAKRDANLANFNVPARTYKSPHKDLKYRKWYLASPDLGNFTPLWALSACFNHPIRRPGPWLALSTGAGYYWG